MSKERELLKKILTTGWLNHELSCEVEKLLAQPEQPEQEPVAWMPKRDLDEQRLPHAEMTEYEKGFADALDEAINIKLQRPKPIEEGELEVWYSQHTWAMDKQEYMWGFRDAEKAYGIGVDDEHR